MPVRSSPTTPVRILIADDHAVVRQGLRAVLKVRPQWAVCGEATTGREAISLAAELRPDIAILDFSMPELNGCEATRQIRQTLPQTEVLILTMHESEQLIRRILAAGAKGYLLKSDAGEVLVQAVEHLCRHQPFLTAKVAHWVVNGQLRHGSSNWRHPGSADRLTPRETEIVQLIAEGKTTKEVADALRITFKTVDTHRTNIMQKLGIHSVSELVRYAIRNQIIEP